MSDPKRWTAIETEFLQDCAVFTVSRTASLSPRTGSRHTFYRIDSTDWVNIVPVTERGEVVMVRQYRHGLEEITLEIPGGMVDPGESPETAATRELLEETGYRARDVTPIGTVNPNPALFGNRVHTYAAWGAEKVAEIRNEGAEETRVELVPLDDLPGRVAQGEVDHALVIAALHFFDLANRARGAGDR
jgi:8-oxo-dGTP pyrophosphatase MutT (NUDIX family)